MIMGRLDNILIEIPKNADARGEAVKILTVPKVGWPARDIIAISTAPGVVRGKHYHKLKEEVFVLLTGKMLVKLLDVQTREKKEITLDAEKKQMLLIHPYVAHSMENIGNAPIWFVEAQNTDYDSGDDYKVEM